jgi:hypothetical protein
MGHHEESENGTSEFVQRSLHSWIKTYGEPKQLDPETASACELAVRERQIEVRKKAVGNVSNAKGNGTRYSAGAGGEL